MSSDLPDHAAESRLGDAVSAPAATGRATVDKTVFGISVILMAAVCIAGVVFTGAVGDAAGAALAWVTGTFGWLFILGATGFVAFSLVLAFGRYGNIPLAQEGETAEFSTLSWIAMMFSAGMGIGLMFFGVYEPVTHLASPPPFVEAAPGTPEAANAAMAYTLFHWGLPASSPRCSTTRSSPGRPSWSWS
jgi:choline-glycine betaine transporter